MADLTLDIGQPPNGHAFGPGDLVNGRVQLQLADGLEAPDVQLVFQGTVKIALKPGFDAINKVAGTHEQKTSKLFTITKTLSPTREYQSGSLQTFAATFSIPFPHHSDCCSGGVGATQPSSNLLPSTRISSEKLKVTVAYTVTASCRRPRGAQSRFNLLSCVQRHLSASRPVVFAPPVSDQLYAPHVVSMDAAPAPVSSSVRPNSPLVGSEPSNPTSMQWQRQHASPSLPAAHVLYPTPAVSRASSVSSSHSHSQEADSASVSDDALLLPGYSAGGCAQPQLVRSTAWLPASKLNISICPSKPTADHLMAGLDCLPAYTPAMMLEAVMPSLPIVTPGFPMPLDIFVHTPPGVLAAASSVVVLRSMTVRLRKSTVARIGSSMRVDDPSWPLWSFSGAVPIRDERVDVASFASWDKVLNVPSTVRPGFWSCFVSRTYSLEITMGVSTQAAPGTIQYAKTSIRVMVSEPPPAYKSG